MTIPSDDFTILETEEPLDESAIEVGRANTDGESRTANTSEPIPTPIIRRHVFPSYFPLLTLLRYISVSYATDFVTAEFDTPAIRHSAVSFDKY